MGMYSIGKIRMGVAGAHKNPKFKSGKNCQPISDYDAHLLGARDNIRLGIYTFFAEGEKLFEMLGIYRV